MHKLNVAPFPFTPCFLRFVRLPTLAAVFALLLLTGAASSGRAQNAIRITPDPLIQSVIPGASAVFTVTLQNVSDATVFLNADDINFDAPGLTLTDHLVDNFPASLDSTASASGTLFTVDVANSVAAGDYAGTFTLKGGARGAATTDPLGPSFDPLTTVAFTVRVAAVPELGTVWLMGGTLGLLGVQRGRLRKRNAPPASRRVIQEPQT